MKHKVSELSGALLDAAVAKSEGITLRFQDFEKLDFSPIDELDGRYYKPSIDWRVGGPIIERERIWLFPPSEKHEEPTDKWQAAIGCFFFNRGQVAGNGHEAWAEGDTPLIAAMRAYVESKFGEEVDL